MCLCVQHINYSMSFPFLVKDATHQSQVLGNKISLTPFDFNSKNLLCRHADVEPDGLQGRANFVGMSAWLAIDSGTWSATAIRAGSYEPKTHTVKHSFCFQQFRVQLTDYRLHQLVGSFKRQASVFRNNLDSNDPDAIIVLDSINRIMVKRRTTLPAAIVPALPAELDEVVCLAVSPDIGLCICLSRISFRNI